MKKLFLLVALLVLPGFVFAQDVNKILGERLNNEPVGTSFSAAVIDEKGVKFFSVGKTSKLTNAKPVDENTVYEIGSITKVFTGILLAEAVKRGEVALDDPISKHLPKSVKTPKFNGKEITLFDLTTHSSALPSLPDDFAPKDPLNPYADYTVEQMYAFLGRVKLTREIGLKFEYSNLGVGLLGHILALKAGISYEKLVTMRILKPLGMSDTAITFSPSMKSNLALGHDTTGKQTSNWDLPTFAGAGALRSTAKDMAHFISANLGFTKTELSDSLAAAKKTKRSFENSPLKIGFNWIKTKAAEKEIIWHNGGTGGYRSFAGFAEDTKKGVYVVTNGSDSVDDLGMHFINSESPLRKKEEPKTAVTLDEKILERYVGEYQLSPAFSITVTREGGRLFAQATDQPRFEIFAEKEDRFFLKAVKADVEFTKDENGKVNGLVLHQGGGRTPGKKVK
jgi:CubicO group peptidase (beta-lactamase class C family)